MYRLGRFSEIQPLGTKRYLEGVQFTNFIAAPNTPVSIL